MFTDDEKRSLRLFVEVCDKILGRRFLRDFHKQSHHVLIGTLPGGSLVDEYPRYDDDDFRAFMTDYRKLRLDQEETHLFRVMKLLKREGTTEDRALLDGLKNEIREEGSAWWGAVDRDDSGSRQYLTQEEVEKRILYGEISEMLSCG